ncbi:DUF2971 domain-containing protein [bacterium]|nr:DUF2971 domain-containing protein [bacterium]
MDTIKISPSLNSDQKIWRYLTLDKFIDLISRQALYFAPLEKFIDSDPFEGYMPIPALKIFHGALGDTIQFFEKESLDRFEKLGAENGVPINTEKFKRTINSETDKIKKKSLKFMKILGKSIQVNCWNISDYESEAFWKLYSDEGKGVAIESTVESLSKSIFPTYSGNRIHIYPVKYVDFFDESLNVSDCMVDGQVVPLIKRKSYEHENEVRAFIVPDVDVKRLDEHKIEHVFVEVDLSVLIERIHISPFAGTAFKNSVKAVSKAFNIEICKISVSNLLSDSDKLFDLLES